MPKRPKPARQRRRPRGNAAKGNAAKAKALAQGEALADNGVLLTLSDVTEDSVVVVKSDQGEFSFKLSEIPYGALAERLSGAVEIERIAATRPLTREAASDDD